MDIGPPLTAHAELEDNLSPGLDKIGKALAELNQHAEDSGAKLSSLGSIAEGVAGGLFEFGKKAFEAAKDVYEMVAASGEAAEKISKLSLVLDVNVQAVQELQLATTEAGVGIGAVESAMLRMEKAIGSNSKQLAKWGLDAKTLAAEPADAAFKEVMQTIDALSDHTQKIAAISDIFGRGAAKSLLPLMEAMDGVEERSRSLGATMSGEQVESLAKVDDKVDDLSVAWERFHNQLSASIASTGIVQKGLDMLAAGLADVTDHLAHTNKESTAAEDAYMRAASATDKYGEAIDAVNKRIEMTRNLINEQTSTLRAYSAGIFQAQSMQGANVGKLGGGTMETTLPSPDEMAKILKTGLSTELTKSKTEMEKLANEAKRLNEEGARFDQNLSGQLIKASASADPFAEKLAGIEVQINKQFAEIEKMSAEKGADAGAMQARVDTLFKLRDALIARATAEEAAKNKAKDAAQVSKEQAEQEKQLAAAARELAQMDQFLNGVQQQQLELDLQIAQRTGDISGAYAAQVAMIDKKTAAQIKENQALVAAGIITQAQADQANDIIRKMGEEEKAAAKLHMQLQKLNELKGLATAVEDLANALGLDLVGALAGAAAEFADFASRSMQATTAMQKASVGADALTSAYSNASTSTGKSALSGAAKGAGAGASMGVPGMVIGGIIGAIAGIFGAAKKRAEELKKKQAEAIDAFKSLYEQWTAARKELAETGAEAVNKITSFLVSDNATAENIAHAGDYLAGAFEMLRKAGYSTADALDKLKPSFDALRDKGVDLTGTPAAGLSKMADFAAANKPMLDFVSGLGQMASALSGFGMLTQDMANKISGDLGGAIQGMIDSGLSQQEAEALNAQALYDLDQAAQRSGVTLDAHTQALIDDAKAGGMFADLEDPAKKLVEVQEQMLVAVAELVKLFGGAVPESIQKMIDTFNNAKPDVHVNVNVNGGGGGGSTPPGDTPPGGDGSGDHHPGPQFAGGSGGIQDFGMGTVATLHGREGVYTKGQIDAMQKAPSNDAVLGVLNGIRSDLVRLHTQLPKNIRDSVIKAHV